MRDAIRSFVRQDWIHSPMTIITLTTDLHLASTTRICYFVYISGITNALTLSVSRFSGFSAKALRRARRPRSAGRFPCDDPEGRRADATTVRHAGAGPCILYIGRAVVWGSGVGACGEWAAGAGRSAACGPARAPQERDVRVWVVTYANYNPIA